MGVDQSVTNCKRNKKRNTFFSVFIKYTQLIQPRLNPGIKKIHGRDQGSSFATIWGSRIKIYGLNVGSVGKKNVLVTILIQSFLNLGLARFSEYLAYEQLHRPDILARLFAYLSSFIFEILDFLY